MFHMPLSVMEKILRPVIVYLVLVIFLRIFGKRELAQLNPFDLVVLLSLSNTVQNAIIGDDNSVSGGVIGAFALLAINYVLARVLFKTPKLNTLLEGSKTVLIKDGMCIPAAMEKEVLTHEELTSVLNKNGFTDYADVRLCVLEPNGTFYVEGISPTDDDRQRQELMRLVEKLGTELGELRAELRAAKG